MQALSYDSSNQELIGFTELVNSGDKWLCSDSSTFNSSTFEDILDECSDLFCYDVPVVRQTFSSEQEGTLSNSQPMDPDLNPVIASTSTSIEIQDVSGILNSIHPNLLFDFASKSNSASSEDFKCSKDEMLKTRDKKIFRRMQNNKASRESRLRKKEEFQRLLEEQHLKEKRKKDLENEVAHLQGGIEELYASQERSLETAIQGNPNVSLPLFLEQLLQLIRQSAIEKNSTGEVYSKTIENVIKIYQRIMERNFGKEEKVMVREWLQSHLVSTNNSF